MDAIGLVSTASADSVAPVPSQVRITSSGIDPGSGTDKPGTVVADPAPDVPVVVGASVVTVDRSDDIDEVTAVEDPTVPAAS